MRIWTRRWDWTSLGIGVAGLILGGFLGGCGRQAPVAEKPEVPVSVATTSNQHPVTAVDPRPQQSFAEATVAEPPPDWQRPPDTTISGKSVGRIYTDVVHHWDEIKFVSPAGKKLDYSMTLDTEMGPIEIALRPDLAPNHVRSFVALAQAGYYDGLVFERTVRAEGAGGKLELIEAGCPVGTGEIGHGSIGYWLKREIKPEAHHEEGTVGASHGESADTAACKFYITLGKTQFMDGEYTIFGKVTQGLDVARKILSLPVHDTVEHPEGDRPVKPVVIRKAVVNVKEVE